MAKRSKRSDGAATPAGPDPSQLVARVRLTAKDERVVFAEPGETCERVPPASLGWLVEQGLVGPAE